MLVHTPKCSHLRSRVFSIYSLEGEENNFVLSLSYRAHRIHTDRNSGRLNLLRAYTYADEERKPARRASSCFALGLPAQRRRGESNLTAASPAVSRYAEQSAHAGALSCPLALLVPAASAAPTLQRTPHLALARVHVPGSQVAPALCYNALAAYLARRALLPHLVHRRHRDSSSLRRAAAMRMT